MKIRPSTIFFSKEDTEEIRDILRRGCTALAGWNAFTQGKKASDRCRKPVVVLTYGTEDSFMFEGYCEEHKERG